MKKICIICKKDPVTKGIRTSYCVPCNREMGRKNYRENKSRYFAQAKKRDGQMDKLINNHKNKPCADCNVSYPPYVMDFDHIPEKGKKFLGICHMRRRRMSFSKVEAEIKKCEVVCSNCHRIRTNQRRPARYSKPQKSPGAT